MDVINKVPQNSSSQNPELRRHAVRHIERKVKIGYSEREIAASYSCSSSPMTGSLPAIKVHVGTPIRHEKLTVNVTNRQIGVLVRYPDDTLEFAVFSLSEIIKAIKDSEKPQQLRLFE